MKKLFTSENVITLVIILVMLNNVEHLAWVHYDIARHVFPTILMNKAHSIIVVVIIELAIIVLVRRGMDAFAGVYTVMLLALSLLYYPMSEYWKTGEYARFIAAIIYSLMFTLSIWYFARMAAEKKLNAAKEEGYKQKWYAANKQLEQNGSKLQKLEAELQQIRADREKIAVMLQQKQAKLQQIEAAETIPVATYQELQQKLQQLEAFRRHAIELRTCEKCGQVFPSEASKRSHVGRCQGKTESVKVEQ
jgi:predicted Zn-ribbon and HTH transcriptional regulator